VSLPSASLFLFRRSEFASRHGFNRAAKPPKKLSSRTRSRRCERCEGPAFRRYAAGCPVRRFCVWALPPRVRARFQPCRKGTTEIGFSRCRTLAGLVHARVGPG